MSSVEDDQGGKVGPQISRRKANCGRRRPTMGTPTTASSKGSNHHVHQRTISFFTSLLHKTILTTCKSLTLLTQSLGPDLYRRLGLIANCSFASAARPSPQTLLTFRPLSTLQCKQSSTSLPYATNEVCQTPTPSNILPIGNEQRSYLG